MTDILNSRRTGSDVAWILKDYESNLSYFNNYKSKEAVIKSLLDSLEFKYDIKMLSDKLGKSEAELLKEAESILSSMSHNIGMNSIRFMGVTLSKIMKRLYSHVHVNNDGIEKLRNAFVDSNVVLMPTHRSYADFLLVSYVMFYYNLPMPVIAAAMDFMNMKFVGELLRSCGAFFIRRSFVDDDMYWTVFSHYIKTLIKISQESLEFFIEGTRSRTNKSLYPKIGMLGIILEMWLSGSADIKIVPIGISYDRILEEKLYAWELFGVPKPKESTSGLFKVRHILSENFGNVYFNVGEPISISTLAEQFGVRRKDHSLQLRYRPSLFESEKQFLRLLSKIIVDNQQQNIVVSDWSVIVLILLSHDISGGKRLTKVELLRLFKDMTSLLLLFGAKVAVYLHKSDVPVTDVVAMEHINESLEVHKGLISEDDSGIELRSGALISDLNTVIVDQIHMGMYRNPTLFHVAKESLIINRIRRGTSINRQEVLKDFSDVMDLFSREFIYGGTADNNFDISVGKLRQSKLLIGEWSINDQHPSLEIIESAITLYSVAYVVYGHVYVTEIVPRIGSIELCDQVKLMQKTAIELCRRPDWIGQRYLEICSLDIARNALAQMTEISRRSSLFVVKERINALNEFLPKDIRQYLSVILLGTI